MSIDRTRVKDFMTDAVCYLVGSLLMGFSVVYFAAPNNISVGGITGLATILNYAFNDFLPIGLLAILLNVPIFIFAFFMLGKEMLVRSGIAMLLSSVAIDLISALKIPPYSGDMVVAALFAGVVGGAGLGIIFLRGATTGGTDMLSRLIKVKATHIEVGKIMLVLEGVLLIATTLVYKNINNALYSMIAIFTYSKLVDAVLYGIDYGKSYFIISGKPEEISQSILKNMDRGVTLLNGEGGYTGEKKQVILTAVRNSQTGKLREIVRQIDPEAFIIVCNTTETIGEGFKSIRDNK